MKVENTALGTASISPRATDAHCRQKRLIRLVTFWWIRRLKKKKKNTYIYINQQVSLKTTNADIR